MLCTGAPFTVLLAYTVVTVTAVLFAFLALFYTALGLLHLPSCFCFL